MVNFIVVYICKKKIIVWWYIDIMVIGSMIIGIMIVLVMLLFLVYRQKRKSKETIENIIGRLDLLFDHMEKKYLENGMDEPMDDNILRFVRRFRIKNITEISPNNPEGLTSYVVNKEKMVLCLRDENGEIHDMNTLMFVVLHEVTHMMLDTWDHDKNFWSLFKTVLREAVDVGIYDPVDYAVSPKKYCGIQISSNPLYIQGINAAS
jgi:hypothetical protein